MRESSNFLRVTIRHFHHAASGTEVKIMKVHDRLIALTFLSGVVLSAAVNGLGQEVQYNYLKGTDFSKYKTYRWVKLEQLEYPEIDVDQKIRQSIDALLSTRGLTRVEEGTADLLAIYQAALTKERLWVSYNGGGGGYWDYGGWYGWGGGGEQKRMTSVHVGTLNLDFYDVAARKQVWRGEATKTLNPPKDPAKGQAKIDKAVKKLLRNFPPTKMD